MLRQFKLRDLRDTMCAAENGTSKPVNSGPWSRSWARQLTMEREGKVESRPSDPQGYMARGEAKARAACTNDRHRETKEKLLPLLLPAVAIAVVATVCSSVAHTNRKLEFVSSSNTHCGCWLS